MKKILCMSVVIISILYYFSLSVCLAVHDDETLKSGGAWQPAEMNVGPDRSDSDKKIDKMLERSFKKSEILIPPKESEKNEETGSEESEKDPGNPVNNDQ